MMRITEGQLRRIIRKELFLEMSSGRTLTAAQDFKGLQPGDNLTLNGKPIVVIGVSPMTGEVDYVEKGKATRKYFDYRYAVPDNPGDLPDYDVVYLGPGAPPENTRLPRR